jgi:hypothetical protein
MEAVIAWWGQYGQLTLIVLGVLVGLATFIARGEGKELAKLTIDLVLRLSSQGWDTVTEKQVKDLAGLVFDGARDFAGPPWLRLIPWRLFITREAVQDWAWTAWMAAHRWFDSALAGEAVEAARAAKVVPKGVTL